MLNTALGGTHRYDPGVTSPWLAATFFARPRDNSSQKRHVPPPEWLPLKLKSSSTIQTAPIDRWCHGAELKHGGGGDGGRVASRGITPSMRDADVCAQVFNSCESVGVSPAVLQGGVSEKHSRISETHVGSFCWSALRQ